MSSTPALHPLHGLIAALSDELAHATADYCTTGLLLMAAERDRNTFARLRDERHAEATAAALNDPSLGTNDKQRSANLALRLAADVRLATARHDLDGAEVECRDTERRHKNAYHEMESLRVRLGAYTALLGGAR